ncbi:MAG: 50S ribosomal protein L29 [Chlamydiales bacterium]|nr:50S ribosomal protein L29 [Chlamydiales bacterium]
MLKAKDLRDESIEELESKLSSFRSEIFELRSQRLDSKSQKTHLIGQKKKEIARILTILTEKKNEG